MNDLSHLLLTPPIALLIYALAVAGLSLLGRRIAAQGSDDDNHSKATIYSGGELPPARHAAPGYRPFFVIALFFAILHLGVLMLGSSGLTPLSGLYLGGLLMVLLALILG